MSNHVWLVSKQGYLEDAADYIFVSSAKMIFKWPQSYKLEYLGSK